MKRMIALDDALSAFEEFSTILAPAVERIEISGNVRRKQPRCYEIVVLAVPKILVQSEMFEPTIRQSFDMLIRATDDLLRLGRIKMRMRPRKNEPVAWTPQHRALVLHRKDGSWIPFDLFWCQLGNWGVVQAIKTGPPELTMAMCREYGVTEDDGVTGLLPPDLKIKSSWLKERRSGRTVYCYEEEDFLRRVNVNKPPEER
jgi:hypothetical protein